MYKRQDLFLADELIDYADTQGTTLYVLNQDISLNQWKRERDQRLYALLDVYKRQILWNSVMERAAYISCM